MGAALNTASASNAYVLADRGTWLSFKNKGDLVIAVEGDKRLFNQYGVMLVNPQKHPNVKKELGQQFIDWLVSPEGQKAIADYKINGEQLFYPNANDPARECGGRASAALAVRAKPSDWLRRRASSRIALGRQGTLALIYVNISSHQRSRSDVARRKAPRRALAIG